MFDRRPEWAALAVGWVEDAAPVLFRGFKKGGQTASNTKKCGAGLAGSANGFMLVDGYAATFFVALVCDLGVGFFAFFALSFAANSCLTVAEMASTSTLYTCAASRRIFAASA
jgi:hypothetical protein